ncbi:Heparan-alpha-glucosaminide N-acetyltransferase, partial [Gryllus bimaculatus]
MSWIEDPGVTEFRGLNLSSLGVDEAFVNITSDIPNLWIYTLSSQCYKCPFSRKYEIDDIQEPLKYSTRYSEKWRVVSDGFPPTISTDNQSSVLCEVDMNLGEFGVYDLWIHDGGGEILCEFTTMLKPVNIYFPLVICVLGLILLWGLVAASAAIVNQWKQNKNRTIAPIGHELETSDDKDKISPNKKSTSRRRVKALDTFRGISIVLMIFVNYGAGSYAILEHAIWNGLQLADVVFPWFMWIMGVCIPISVTSQMKRNVSRFKMFAGVLRRSCILFLLGVMLNTLSVGSHLETLRIFGVLQRFGVVYFVVATISICFSCRHCNTPKVKCIAAIQDILILLPQWIVVACFVAGHCALTFLLPIPDCPMMSHISVQAGTIIVVHQGWKGRLIRWWFWGTLAGVGGAVLCLASKEDGWIPLNKNL